MGGRAPLQRLPAAGGRLKILARQEHHARRQVIVSLQPLPQPLHFGAEEADRNLEEDAGPVACLGVGVDSAAMREVGDAAQGHVKDAEARLA